MQYYTSAIAADVTPRTTDGVEVRLFDGYEWTTPESEFYVEREPGMIVSFRNPDGSERIDIPLDRDKELVVVRRKPDEIGTGEATATRVIDAEAEEVSSYVSPSTQAAPCNSRVNEPRQFRAGSDAGDPHGAVPTVLNGYYQCALVDFGIFGKSNAEN